MADLCDNWSLISFLLDHALDRSGESCQSYQSLKMFEIGSTGCSNCFIVFD